MSENRCAKQLGNIVPAQTARAECSWRKRHSAYRWYKAGITQGNIAKVMGLTKGRVHQMCRRSERELLNGRSSPLEQFIDDDRIEMDGKRISKANARKLLEMLPLIKWHVERDWLFGEPK